MSADKKRKIKDKCGVINEEWTVKHYFMKVGNKALEHKTGIDLTVSSTLKKTFKKLCMFYFETFRIILNPSSVKKIKQHLAMSAIQNHKAL